MTFNHKPWILAAFSIVLPMARALQPLPLPAFQLLKLDGSAIQSTHLGPTGQWLILYLQPECRACEGVLQLIKQKEQHPNLPSHLVIVGGMTLPQMNALAAKYPDLSTALWTVDPTGTVSKQLKMVGAPTVLGVRQSTVMWSVGGTLKDPLQLKTIVESWTR